MDKQKNTIGLLNEHTLHLSLKNYLQPDKRFQEQEYEGYIADIKQDHEIIEIETRSFSNIKKKAWRISQKLFRYRCVSDCIMQVDNLDRSEERRTLKKA